VKQGFFIFLMLFIMTAHATVYMRTDANGNVGYSDVPGSGAQEITPTAGSTVSSVPSKLPTPSPSELTTPVEKKSASVIPAVTEKKPYTIFLIEKPKDQETMQNQSVITVLLKVEPDLDAADSVQLILDDHPYGVASKSTNLELVDVDRGTHRLYAVLLDARNTVLKRSNEITIFVHRTSVIKPGAFKVPAKKIIPVAKKV